MTTSFDDEDRLKVQRSIQYFVNEHGEDAAAEAKSALQYAKQMNDQGAVDVFQAVLDYLSKTHSI